MYLSFTCSLSICSTGSCVILSHHYTMVIKSSFWMCRLWIGHHQPSLQKPDTHRLQPLPGMLQKGRVTRASCWLWLCDGSAMRLELYSRHAGDSWLVYPLTEQPEKGQANKYLTTDPGSVLLAPLWHPCFILTYID